MLNVSGMAYTLGEMRENAIAAGKKVFKKEWLIMNNSYSHQLLPGNDWATREFAKAVLETGAATVGILAAERLTGGLALGACIPEGIAGREEGTIGDPASCVTWSP